MRLTLASSSPRRQALLATLLTDFDTASPDIDERLLPGESPEQYVSRLAGSKARVCDRKNDLTLGADTAVALGHRILGKPLDRDDAAAMLEALSGQTHEVYTAVALSREGSVQQVCTCTSVTFATLSRATIGEYLATDEPWDKAGAYGIQGYAGAFVQQIVGSYSAVVGLPLYETRHMLQRAGLTMRHG
jgi:septum formation protein